MGKGLLLNTATHGQCRGDDEIEATAWDFGAFSYLKHHPGQIETKSQLPRHTWNDSEGAHGCW
jgi:DNA-binding response OmpR family regulator